MLLYKNYKPDQSLKLVFLGCGNIVQKHVKTIRSVDKHIELGFASRSEEKAIRYNEDYKGFKAYGDYYTAIADPEVDILFITTPPNSHFELAEKSLSNSKHVIVEKPPFFSAADFDKLEPIIQSNKVQLLVSENYYYRPIRYRIKELIASGVIGDPLFINISATKKQKSKNDWREDASISGYGALFEGGIHWINFMNNLGLNIDSIKGFKPVKAQQLERSIQVTATTSEGPIINLQYSWEVDTMFFGLRLSRIYGTEGSITFESNGVTIIVRGKKKRIQFPELRFITGFKPMFSDFFVSLRAGKEPSFNYKMAKSDLELIEQVYASLKRN